MHRFIPADGLHVLVDPTRDDMPFVLARDHHFHNTITSVTAPSGYRCDFASVPRLLWWLFPRVGRYSRAAVFHDILYDRGEIPRVQADSLFMAIMEHDCVPYRTRWALYLAVRCFGWRPWYRRHGRRS
ncbi:MAG: DUF1353 domain-containing protein [Planctomycetota bacterium]